VWRLIRRLCASGGAGGEFSHLVGVDGKGVRQSRESERKGGGYATDFTRTPVGGL
jgi:hypothetical protein